MQKEEYERRKPVWIALSDFFLDTELCDRRLAHIATIIKNSGYSQEEIKEILINELFPALNFNLQSVAGEWAGFPEDWLLKRIEETKHTSAIQKTFYHTQFGMVKHYWDKVIILLGSIAKGDCPR